MFADDLIKLNCWKKTQLKLVPNFHKFFFFPLQETKFTQFLEQPQYKSQQQIVLLCVEA